MTKIKYYENLGTYGDLGDFYSNATFVPVVATLSTETAVYRDIVSLNEVRLTGENFTYYNGVVTGGTIETVKFTTLAGATFLKAESGSYDAATLLTTLRNDGVDALLTLLMSGKDTIRGSGIADDIFGGGNNDKLYGGAGNDKAHGGSGADYLYGEGGQDKLYGGLGNDTLYGGASNDTMTGNGGSDSFQFVIGTGNDTITDFDAIGGGLKQDHLLLRRSQAFTTRDTGDDLVLKFSDGHTLTLQDVDAGDFSARNDVTFF